MTGVLVAVLAGGVALPHLVDLEAARPAHAAGVWLAALFLRALLAVLGAVFVVFFFPATELFSLVTHWCRHAVVPFVAGHLPLDGHSIGGAAVLLPVLFLAASTMSVLFGLWRATRAVRTLMDRTVVGTGPQHSLVLADEDVLVAAAGLLRPQVLVSAGALTLLDDEELAASLAHEHGHIVRRHRWILVAAELFRAFARFLPGTRAAAAELLFHLERDADAYALRRHEGATLASAICKAAESQLRRPSFALGGSRVVRRVEQLLEEPAPGRGRSARGPLLAVGMAVLTLFALTSLPEVAHAAMHEGPPAALPHQCEQ